MADGCEGATVKYEQEAMFQEIKKIFKTYVPPHGVCILINREYTHYRFKISGLSQPNSCKGKDEVHADFNTKSIYDAIHKIWQEIDYCPTEVCISVIGGHTHPRIKLSGLAH